MGATILRPTEAQVLQFAGTPFQQHYPVALDSTKTFLVDQNGTPCFGLGDAPQNLVVELTSAQVEQYLADRASRGINIIWFYPVDNTYSSNPPDDANGDAPFSGGDFLGMSSQTAYWNFVDHVMQRCLAYGITVAFNPMFVGLNGTSGYLNSVQAASTATLQGYANFLGARYGKYPNIIWLAGGDADPNISGLYSQINIFMTALKLADTGNHLAMLEACRFSDVIGAAPNGGYSSVDALTLALGLVPAWLGINWVYQTFSTILSGAQRCYSQGYPCLLGEDWYEQAGAITGGSTTTPVQNMAEGYLSVLGGCTLGRLFANVIVWGFGSANALGDVPTWQSQLSSPATIYQQLMGNLFRSREFGKLVPDLSNAVMMSAGGSGGACARTSDGQTVIVFTPAGGPFSIIIAMSSIVDSGSQANCNWYNPATGVVTAIGLLSNSGSHTFTTPDANSWVLVIDSNAANLRTPGT